MVKVQKFSTFEEMKTSSNIVNKTKEETDELQKQFEEFIIQLRNKKHDNSTTTMKRKRV